MLSFLGLQTSPAYVLNHLEVLILIITRPGPSYRYSLFLFGSWSAKKKKTDVRESSPETAAFDADYFQWASRLNEVTSRYANQKRAAEAELEKARETLQDGIRKLQDEYQERVQKLKAIAKEQQRAIRRELEFHIDDLHLLRLTDEVSTKGTSL